MALESISLSLAANALGSAVGLVFGIPYDILINKLKDGDLTDEALREFLVPDSTEIKSTLDCLSLMKDLGWSYNLLYEGVVLLNQALDKLSKNQKESEGQEDEVASDSDDNDSAFAILNTAVLLPQKFRETSSKGPLTSAKVCFTAARKDATLAFNNRALKIKDRIEACKFRIAARILETGIENPEEATAACRWALEELHRLPAIRKMFSVFLKGGFRSWVFKRSRLENIKSVLFINHSLFDFAARCCSTEYPDVFTWPGMKLESRTFNPILHTHEILTKATKITSSEEFVKKLRRIVVDTKLKWSCFGVNSRGEIILLFHDKMTVTYRNGESEDFMFPDPRESNLVEQKQKAIAVDSNDNVYVVRSLKRRVYNDECFELRVFDERYNLKHNSILDNPEHNTILDYLDADLEYSSGIKIAVDQNKNLIMIKKGDVKVSVFDNTGKLKFSPFTQNCPNSRNACSLTTSNKNNIMIPLIPVRESTYVELCCEIVTCCLFLCLLPIATRSPPMQSQSDDKSTKVAIYTTTGKLVSSEIRVPVGHEICHVAFHHGICKVIVLTYVEEENSWFLLCYSKTGKLAGSVFFCKRDPGQSAVSFEIDMISHPSGPVAVLWDKIITLI